ncbi:ribosomal L28 family-domain-containing protein [Dichotomopilus funicola]|uniref:Large ribosomal subunit protein bL28m n=1 Tax=Dichotomopilus funicola TaxID=1934379 RepID=A0AAN6UVR7_9PEZI|nr:ribosomal L28 family-domain-containing protein [Dichotomopilus funicola]
MPPIPPAQTCLRAATRSTTTSLQSRQIQLPASLNPTRAFSTAAPSFYKQTSVPGSDLRIPTASGAHPEIPPYPYGPRQTYHQSNTGLYGSASIRFGNNVSEKNEIKTRRNWRPNVQQKRIWSKSLGMFVRTRVTTRVLRTIDKVGGLDEYLLGRKPQRVKDLGPWGWKLRWRIMQTPVVRARLAAEREALGLPPKEEAEIALESLQTLPGGVAAREALLAETDQMLAKETEFELGTEEASGTAQPGFMSEKKPQQ